MAEPKSVRFGEFEVDLQAWVIRRNNSRIGLQRKPFQILRLLLSRPGEVITRDELANALWPDLHVSYDHCLNTAINVLRKALGDATSKSRFIETHPGVGYRFAGPISTSVGWEEKPIDRDASEPDLTMGYYFLHRFSFESLARARACFTAALESCGKGVSGHVALAEIENLTAVCGYAPTREASDRAVRHARAALQSSPMTAGARVAFAVALGLRHGVYDEAMSTCSSALEESTQSLGARVWLAEFLCARGRTRDAVGHLQIAKRINPVSLLIRSKLSLALYFSGDYEAAVQEAWAALSMEPACAGAQYALALAYQQLGCVDEAVTEFENAVTCSGNNPAALAALCYALHEADCAAQGLEIAARLKQMARLYYVSPCWQALVQLASGERASAEQSLVFAAEAGDFLFGFVHHDPRFKSLRSE